ncbi:MAG: TolC family protein, partial [Phycisphaerales bacterium]|nr:TolC family protein [Phycisphaerales bacterium]
QTPEALADRAAAAGTVKGAQMEWSLEQARASAVAHNLDLKVFLVDPAIARQAEEIERSKFDAIFRPSLSAFKTDRPSVNSTTVTQVNGINAGAGIDIPLRTGGTLSLDATGSYQQVDNPFVTFADAYTVQVRPSLSLPLMRGLGRGVTTASIKIAGYQSDISSAGTRLQIMGILAETERTYWRLVASRQELEVRKKQFDLARTQLDRARRKVDAGDLAQIEVTRAQSGVAARVEAVINAETSVLVQQRALKRLSNDPSLPVEGDAMIVPATPPEIAAYDLAADALLPLAEANRMELLQGELQVLSDSLNIDLASDATRPVLNLLAQYDVTGARDRLASGVRQLSSLDYQSYSLGVQGQVPLGNGQAEAGLRRAILTRLRTIGSLASRRQTVRQEVLDALDRVGSAWQRIIAAQQASLLAGRTLEAESRQFDRGARTSTDVLNAAAALADAQSAEVRAVADYRIALVDLAVATGTVLGSARVTWEEAPAPPLSGDRWSGLRPAQPPPNRGETPAPAAPQPAQENGRDASAPRG